MKYSELSTGRLIGTGQFGSVRIVTHTPTGHVYALKVGLCRAWQVCLSSMWPGGSCGH